VTQNFVSASIAVPVDESPQTLCSCSGVTFFFFDPDELPDFVPLQATDPHIANVAVMIRGPGAIHINRRLRDCIGCDCGSDSGRPAVRNVLARTPDPWRPMPN